MCNKSLIQGFTSTPVRRHANSSQCKPEGTFFLIPFVTSHKPVCFRTIYLCCYRLHSLSTELTAGGELDDGAMSFKTRAFRQKKELLEALIREGMKKEEGDGGGTVG